MDDQADFDFGHEGPLSSFSQLRKPGTIEHPIHFDLNTQSGSSWTPTPIRRERRATAHDQRTGIMAKVCAS
ncbi:hypothetical protein LJR129_005163 [Acidovorax sp. LjRoot129]|uniref:hypothetical protein n=1 Tax=Acidovorax sp. LjRoot129 TaxID=3342260 RepID=UPI003ECCCD62